MNATPLLQPERGTNESRQDYVARRRTSHDYVKSQLAGTISWNPQFQGTFFNEEKAKARTFGKGKSARRVDKRLRRVVRANQAPAAPRDEGALGDSTVLAQE